MHTSSPHLATLASAYSGTFNGREIRPNTPIFFGELAASDWRSGAYYISDNSTNYIHEPPIARLPYHLGQSIENGDFVEAKFPWVG